MCGEKDYPFVECSTWSDKIRAGGWNDMFFWHFKDIPMFEENFTPENKSDVPEVRADNAAWAINEAIKTLSSSKIDRKGKSESLLGKSIQLRNLIHIVGDIH